MTLEQKSGGLDMAANGATVSRLPQTKQPSRAILLRKLNEEEDEPWAEVAKFNQLLDMKIKLDEASEVKRKANIQRAYLD